MNLLAPDPISTDERRELELLIREARRRQRRRRLLAALLLVLAAGGVYLGVQSTASTPQSGSLLARRLHFPSLGPGGRCPATSGYAVNNAYFGGSALGNGPVRVLLGNTGNVHRGRFYLGTTAARGWFAFKTIWFAMPGYNGPFVVRAARLGKRGPIEVQPSGTGESPGSGPLVVPAGPTINSYPPPTVNIPWAGYRTVPGSTWVKSPGCYAWQVDGRGFSEDIVIDAVAVHHG